jgi:hypothetical protein
MRPRLLLLAALAPALVLAAPHRKKTTKKTTPKSEGSGSAEPSPSPSPTPEPAGSASPPPSPLPQTPGDKGAGSGSAEPKKGDKDKDAKTEDQPTEKSEGDVDSLRQEYLTLRDELFKSRARANAVASQLYSTQIQIKLTYTSGRFYNPAKSSIRLDGASVYENTSGAIAGDDGVRFEGFVAPGRHVITFRIEATGKDDDSFTSVSESQIVVKAVANKDLIVAAKAKDSGDIAYEWKRHEKGSYGLGIDVSVKTAGSKK